MSTTSNAPAPAATKPTCPFCRSEVVTTTSKAAENVYWRCQSCGQIWNPARLTAFHRSRSTAR